MSVPVIDQTNDPGHRELVDFGTQFTFPDYVKKANTLDVTKPPSQTMSNFADVRGRGQFPIHTKAATFVSYCFFLNKEASLTPTVAKLVRDRLDGRVEYWGMKNAVDQLHVEHKQASAGENLPDSAYMLVTGTKEGKKRRFRMKGAIETKTAAQWFCANQDAIRHEFPFQDRSRMAQKVLDRASKLGADLRDEQDLLERQAGQGTCVPSKAAAHIRNRITVGNRVPDAIAMAFNKLADQVESQPTTFQDPATLVKLASTIEDFDREHNLVGKYSSGVPDPESICFNLSFSKMAELSDDACSTLTGSMYTKNQLGKVNKEAFSSLFGSSILEKVCTGISIDPEKMAEMVGTLPLGDAQMFDDLMQHDGIAPLAKEATVRTGYTPEELRELADSLPS